MDSITINTGVKRIAINGDPARVISFNPTDVTFAERFYGLMQNFEAKQRDYQARAEALDAETGVDENGLPVNLADRIAFMRDVCEYMHAQIDTLFGAETSLKVFEGALDLDLIAQFFEGVTPFVQSARAAKIEQYSKPSTKKRVMR
jgi:hypothetical protein